MADNRSGKKYKTERSVRTKHTGLDDLFMVFYNARVAKGVSERTLETYRENYRYFCDFMREMDVPFELLSVTPDLIRRYITWMRTVKRKWNGHAHKSEEEKTVGLSPVTINIRLKPLRAMFNFLEKEDLIQTNPFNRVDSVLEPENEIEVLRSDDLSLLLKTPNKRTYAGFRDHVFMSLLVDGFLRINEGLAIKASDINFSTGMLHLEAAKVKTRKGRSVPLSPLTLRLIKELIKENEAFETEFIFLTNYGGRISDDRMRDRIKQHAKEAGIETRVFPHLFRHSAATLYLENGGDIRSLAEILGHRDLRMTMRYTHLSKENIKSQHEKFSPLISVVSPLSKQRKSTRGK